MLCGIGATSSPISILSTGDYDSPRMILNSVPVGHLQPGIEPGRLSLSLMPTLTETTFAPDKIFPHALIENSPVL
jgi:hypothetical protein